MRTEVFWGIMNGSDLLTFSIRKIKQDAIDAFVEHYNNSGKEPPTTWRSLRERTYRNFHCKKLAVVDHKLYERLRKQAMGNRK